MAKVGVDSSGEVRQSLTAMEKSQMTIGPAITTTTFFRGDPKAALALLTERLKLVVEANPWLAGTLKKGGSGLELGYPSSLTAGALDSLVNPTLLRGKPCKKALVLSNTMDYVSVCRAVLKTAAEVPPGRLCKNKPFPQLALTVVPDAKEPDAAFCVVFSVSHVLVDGHGYYQLLAMLSAGAEIKALSPVRKHDINRHAKEVMGEKEFKFQMRGAIICNVLCKMLCGGKARVANMFVDKAKVQEEKDKAKAAGAAGGPEWVSTNDVLASRFFSAAGVRAGMMPINLRGKHPNYLSDDAGNYEGSLTFMEEDYAQPATIRSTLQTGNPTFLRLGRGEGKPDQASTCANKRASEAAGKRESEPAAEWSASLDQLGIST